MHPYLEELKPKYNQVIDQLKEDLSALRTGRANPAMVENISVQAYDSTMKVKELASIKSEDAQTLVIDPFDKNTLEAIEKGIRDADVGVSPAVDGEIIRMSMPSMTEENRKEIVKKIGKMLEEAKVKLRQVREEAREEVMKMEKEKGIGEDEKYKILDEIDTVTRDYTEKIDNIGETKEKEIMTV